MASGSKAYSLIGFVATVAATVATRRLLSATWALATGKPPPDNPEHPDVSMAEAVAWAALSGVAVGLARTLASRKTADYYRRTTGRLPAGLEDVTV